MTSDELQFLSAEVDLFGHFIHLTESQKDVEQLEGEDNHLATLKALLKAKIKELETRKALADLIIGTTHL